ncbi:hypothetical protein VARIO8X_60010 [Burkholderiales bacterium 8X]|nr:hypothetical protein VARIO8X_60010 [Burkholderiales bacterium 8X]
MATPASIDDPPRMNSYRDAPAPVDRPGAETRHGELAAESLQARPHRARLIGALLLVVALILCASVLVWRVGEPVAARGVAAVSVPAPAPESVAAFPSRLNELRSNAEMGDAISNALLVAVLLDRYERDGSANDLFEAVQWLEREWFLQGRIDDAGIGRVYLLHCGHPVMAWHWFCLGSGE